MIVTQRNIELTAALMLHKYQLRCFLNATHILHDVQLEWNFKCKNISTPRVTSCEGQWKDVVRSCLNFGFQGAIHPLKNNRGLGACPQTKLTISVAEILSIHRKWTSTCKSRDSRKSSKKQNQRIGDFAFGLGCDCKAVALKHNDFMKHGASNLLLGRQLILSCSSTLCVARLATCSSCSLF